MAQDYAIIGVGLGSAILLLDWAGHFALVLRRAKSRQYKKRTIAVWPSRSRKLTGSAARLC